MMRDNYNFDCGCEGCDIDEDEEEKENNDCEHFREVERKRQELRENSSSGENMAKEISYLKEMLRLSGEIKTISLKNVLSIIVEDGYDVCCARCLCEGVDDQKDEDLEMFTSLGLHLSTLLHGETNSVTNQWRERRRDPMKCYTIDQT